MNRGGVQSSNIILGIFFKGLGICINLLLIPLLIVFLGKTEYGVWVTIFSIVNWIFTFDLGIGTGLRNKLTESLSENNYELASEITSTSYVIIAFFSLFLLVVASISIYFFDFQNILNFYGKPESFLKFFVQISVCFTIINFTLNLYKKLYLSIHKSFLVEFSNSLFLLLYLTGVYFWIQFEFKKDLVVLTFIFGITSILIAIVFTILFFKMNNKIGISIYNFRRKHVSGLFKIGGNFFIINVCLLIILFTDNIIISNMLGPSYVSDYAIIQKLFQLFVVFFNVVLASSWGLYSQAIIKEDYDWIKSNFKKMQKYLLLLFVAAFVLVIFIEDVLTIWIGPGIIKIPKNLVLYNIIYFALFSFNNIYAYYINATGKIQIQMILYILGAICNVPLSFLLVKFLDSSSGVMLATIFCTIPLVIAMPFQAMKKIKLAEIKKSNNNSDNY